MTLPEFTIAQGNLAKRIFQTIYLPATIDLTGAIAKFRIQPEGTTDVIERSATLSNFLPSQDGCRSFDVELDAWTAGDLDVPGRYEFQWKLTLLDSTPLNVPELAPTEEDASRVYQIIEITPVI